jgi:hypothetical protein
MSSRFPFLAFLSFFASDLETRDALDGNPDSGMTDTTLFLALATALCFPGLRTVLNIPDLLILVAC